MKTITFHELNAIEAALHHIHPPLLPILQKVISEGKIEHLDKDRGEYGHEIFTPQTEISEEDIKKISAAINSFVQSPDALDIKFKGMLIFGVEGAWTRFIQK